MSQNVAAFIATANRFAQQQRAAQIELDTCVEHSQLCQNVVHYLTEATRLAEEERQQESARVSEHLNELKGQIEQVRRVVQTKQPNIKTLLLTVDGNLQAAREGWILARDSLDERCKELSEQIEKGFERFNEIGSVFESNQAQTTQVQAGPQESRNYKESTALRVIDDELERIGYPTNGWPREVHDSFYSLWLNSRHLNRRRFAEMITQKFPEYTIGALLRHDDFCYKVEELMQRKKAEINKWKSQRSKVAETLHQNYEETERPRSKVNDSIKQQQLAIWREQKAMTAEDEFSFQLREERTRQRDAKLAKQRASRAARERQEKLLCEKELLDEQIAYNQQLMKEHELNRKRGIVSDDQLAKRKEQDALLEAQMKRLQQLQEQRNELQREQLEAEEKKQRFAERLQRQVIGQEVVADFNRLIKPTSAQRIRESEVKQAKETGKSFGVVNVGYDPFAVVPISGGRAGVKW